MVSLPKLVSGYPSLGFEMGRNPETAILRRFGALNVQNTLYLQAEIMSLEKQLREKEEEDARSTNPKKSKYARDWFWLNRSVDDDDDEQWQLVLSLRQKLTEYSQGPRLRCYMMEH
jgi:hypothetical protein